MTQHYARVLDSSILKDMMNVKSVLSKVFDYEQRSNHNQ